MSYELCFIIAFTVFTAFSVVVTVDMDVQPVTALSLELQRIYCFQNHHARVIWVLCRYLLDKSFAIKNTSIRTCCIHYNPPVII